MQKDRIGFGRRGLLALPAGLAAGPVLAQSAEQPRRGGVLTFAIAAEPPTYDLHATGTFAVIQRVSPHYSTLLRYETGNYPTIVGDLAASWEAAPDHMTYTFRLHPNVRFHDGTILTSEDVKASWDRLRAPPDGVVSHKLATFASIASIETPDPLTVVFRMKEVNASMMDLFASPWNSIYSAARLRADANFPARNIMGTGPYRFVEHVAGSHWVGERFDGYFRQGQPYLDGFRAITMSSAAVVNALAGRQVMAEFRGFSPVERDRIVRGLGQDASVQESTWLALLLCTFNTTRAPFNDVRVRRALNMAIDRWGGSQALSRISTLGPVGGVVRPGSEFSATPEELRQWPGFGADIAASRAEARRLLREAGVPNLRFTLTNRSIAPYVTTGVFLIDQWRQIGVQVEHQQVELAAWYQTQSGLTYEAIVDAEAPYNDDPSTIMPKYLSADRSPSSRSGITDRDLDRLFDQQSRTLDKTERRRLIREFEKRVFDLSFSTPILWWQRIVVTNKRVRNYTISPSHMVYQHLADIWLASE
jgi:peptide/nickel transport system substrate-binding protein